MSILFSSCLVRYDRYPSSRASSSPSSMLLSSSFLLNSSLLMDSSGFSPFLVFLRHLHSFTASVALSFALIFVFLHKTYLASHYIHHFIFFLTWYYSDTFLFYAYFGNLLSFCVTYSGVFLFSIKGKSGYVFCVCEAY